MSHFSKELSDGVEKANRITSKLEDDSNLIGSWLCDEGDYRKYIEALSSSNPGLKRPDPKNEKSPLRSRQAKVVLLDSPSDTTPSFTPITYTNSDDLANHFQGESPSNHNRRRIYIMEGLNTKFVSVVGGHFFMDPSFFQRQERTCVWSSKVTPVSDALPQPSLLDPDTMFHLQYCELRQFNKAIKSKPFYCDSTRRHVGMTPPRYKENSTTGIVRRKVGWWSRQTQGGGWDVVIICDPQLEKLNELPKVYDSNTSEFVHLNHHDDLKNHPFQEGYIDFIPHRSPSEIKSTHPHKSMLEDLIHYFENHSDLLEDWAYPSTSSVFVRKIVAAHYLQLVDYIKAMLPSLESRLTMAWIEEQELWKSLQTISRRCGNYRDDIEDTLLSLDYPLEMSNSYPRNVRKWDDSQRDFQYIYFRLKMLKERADTLMSSMTGLASIAGNRQNLEEAKRVKRLNLLALLFIPLAYTSSLFSMQDEYAPGNSKFWLYWVSALGVVGLTFIATWVLDSALDDAAQWTVPFRRVLGSWREKESGASTERQRRQGTGLFHQGKVSPV